MGLVSDCDGSRSRRRTATDTQRHARTVPQGGAPNPRPPGSRKATAPTKPQGPQRGDPPHAGANRSARKTRSGPVLPRNPTPREPDDPPEATRQGQPAAIPANRGSDANSEPRHPTSHTPSHTTQNPSNHNPTPRAGNFFTRSKAVDAPGRPPAPGLAGFVEGAPAPIFAQRLVARRLAHEDETAADGAHRFADRLPGIEVVAQIDRPQPGERRRAIPGADRRRRCDDRWRFMTRSHARGQR